MLKRLRKEAEIESPKLLKDLRLVQFKPVKKVPVDPDVSQILKPLHTEEIQTLAFGEAKSHRPLKVGCLLSGGPAPGGHNVILGLFEGLIQMNPKSALVGFKNGLDGFLSGTVMTLDAKKLADYRNLGGFYLLGSSRKKLKTEEDFALAEKQVAEQKLDALVIIGGDDSNTNAALLAAYLKKKQVNCTVIGVPKTIDGDLRHEYLELSFGFETASKVYAEMIGNILDDAKSAKKYYHFIKIMGRSASHLTLESALLTHPNFTFISEEFSQKKTSFNAAVEKLASVIKKRRDHGVYFGVVLIPEGLLEAIPEFNALIDQLNTLKPQSIQGLENKLSEPARSFYLSLPKAVQNQLLLEKDPHGNIPLSQISTQLVVIEWVKKALSQLGGGEEYLSKFQPVEHFLGYEGRCSFPTQFDCEFGYALGKLGAKMIDEGLTGCLAGMRGLKEKCIDWQPYAIPLSSMIHLEKGGKPVIKKTYVGLSSPAYERFDKARAGWEMEDSYESPGPIQFFGPKELINTRPHILF